MTTTEDIKSRLDIVDTISKYVEIKQSGTNFKGLCPFHKEKTPSFFIFPNTQTWRCFGSCTIGGDIFEFHMKIENIPFIESLHALAKDAGIELQQLQPKEKTSNLLKIHLHATDYFHKNLMDPKYEYAKNYLIERGITEKTISKFKLGFCPPTENLLLENLLKEGCVKEDILSSGLITQTQKNQYTSPFHLRLIIPIQNKNGDVVGFGGRILDNSQPKYINSTASAIFNKSHILFGLDKIPKTTNQKIIIVEGYMDAIIAHQHGFENIVACMGTSITIEQAKLAYQVTNEIILSLDQDKAGQTATMNNLINTWRIFQQHPNNINNLKSITQININQSTQKKPLNLKITELPSGMDPADLINKNPLQWQQILDKAKPLFIFLQDFIKNTMDLNSTQNKLQAASIFMSFISQIPNPIEQDKEFNNLCKYLSISREVLEATLGKPWKKTTSKTTSQPNSFSTSAIDNENKQPIEEYLLKILLENNDLMPNITKEITPEMFENPQNREIYRTIISSKNGEINDLTLDKHLEDQVQFITNSRWPLPQKNLLTKFLRSVINRFLEKDLKRRKFEENLRIQGENNTEVTFETSIIDENKKLLEIFKSNKSI